MVPSGATVMVALFATGSVGATAFTPLGSLPSRTGLLPALSVNGLFGLFTYTVTPESTGLNSPGMLRFAVTVYVVPASFRPAFCAALNVVTAAARAAAWSSTAVLLTAFVLLASAWASAMAEASLSWSAWETHCSLDRTSAPSAETAVASSNACASAMGCSSVLTSPAATIFHVTFLSEVASSPSQPAHLKLGCCNETVHVYVPASVARDTPSVIS